MADIPNVRLNLSNRPENVLLVRQTLAGVAETIALDPVELNDISTAVSEACNNVAVHAYGGGPGPLEVEIHASADALVVVVRDHGTGIRPGLKAPGETGGGIGLPVIRALSENVEFLALEDGGTEVRMTFATLKAGVLTGARGEEHEQPAALLGGGLADTVAMTIAPTSLARAVLPRVMCALAARAYFSTDRISDTQQLADALVAHADGSISGGHLSVGVSVAPRNLAMCVGPLSAARGNALVLDAEDGGLGPVIRRLTDHHELSPDGSSEMLALHLADPR